MSRFSSTGFGRATLAFALSILVFGIASFKAMSAVPRTQIVAIKNFAFVPQTVTVSPGTTVTWTNADEDPHTVTAGDKTFHSSALDTDDKYSFTFTKPGDFTYFCSLHPHMTGKVIVKAG